MLEIIEWLSSYGADPEGGVTRLLYTEPWLQAQLALTRKMHKLGLKADFDAVGNVYGKLQGNQMSIQADHHRFSCRHSEKWR